MSHISTTTTTPLLVFSNGASSPPTITNTNNIGRRQPLLPPSYDYLNISSTPSSRVSITKKIYISIVLKCCLERLLLDKELSDIKSISEMKEFLSPCQHHHHNSKSYLSDVFKFYLNQQQNSGSNTITKTSTECSRSFYTFYCDNLNLSKLQMLYIAILVLTLIIGVLGNSLVCIVIPFSGALRKRVTNYFLLSLAVVDLLCALLVLPVKIATSSKAGRFCMSREVCYVYMTVEPIAFVASITHLFVICIDRFVAINYPYRYTSLFSTRNVKITIACIWCYALAWGVLHHFNWNVFQMGGTFSISNDFRCRRVLDKFPAYLYMVVFVIPCVIMGFLYGRIWYIALLQDREIRKQQHIQAAFSSQSSLHQGSVLTTRKFIIASRVLELRATKVIVVVLGTYLLCWAPLIFMIIIDTLITKIELDKAPYIIVCEYFPNLNSVLNPFIYCLLHNDFQKGLKKVMLERVPYISALKMISLKGRRGAPHVEGRSDSNVVEDRIVTSVCENSVSFL